MGVKVFCQSQGKGKTEITGKTVPAPGRRCPVDPETLQSPPLPSTRKDGNGIQKPQAQKAAGGIDAELPEPADGQCNDAKQQKNQQHGNQKCGKAFHKNLRMIG